MSNGSQKIIKIRSAARNVGNLAASRLRNEEEHILRCLGAALIMQWNTLPTQLRRELFDNAGSMGALLQTPALRGRIARFLHKHKDDEETVAAAPGGEGAERLAQHCQ